MASPGIRKLMRALTTILALIVCATAVATAPPNFIVVLCDDLGIGDVEPYGGDVIATPNLNRMAAEGVTLTSFYSSANFCTPSRGGLLTGRYPVRMDIVKTVAFPNNDIHLPQSEVTIAEALKGAGYATAIVGKWHLGSKPKDWPTRHGFDYYYGLPYSNDMKPLALYRMEENIEEPVDQTTLTERYTGETIDFIEAHKDEPFFVYLAQTMPHVPLFVSKRFEGTSKAGLYGDCVETIDWSMGQIFAALERLGLDESTLVLFTSDNGPWWEGSPGAYRGRKGESFEGGMRVPLLARWPGTLPAAKTSDAIAMNIDIMPTLLAAAGIAQPDGVEWDGMDLGGVLKDGAPSPHEFLYLFEKEVIAGVRTQDWKMVFQSYYRGGNANLGSEKYLTYPGLLFPMNNAQPERYSMTRDEPEVAAKLRGLLDEGNARFVEPYRARQDASK